ncbi:MAG TPA: 2-phospho-L-lactate transferase [Blastocatellia bacterium]|nr:2-phospho-L-lactate transferase [Blastocatellia bacterium]
MITALAGGVGASKFLDGLNRAMPPEDISIIVNTGDDAEFFGVYVSPDVDIVTYTLAGIINRERGWGIAGDTFQALGMLAHYRGPQWFNLGDRDLATCLHRTELMRKGQSLSEITDEVRKALGVTSRILPMTDSHVPTTVLTADGPLHFQEYFVKHRFQIPITGLRFENIESARPAPGVIEAICGAEAVIICPSNPLISIGPILAVPGVRDLLKSTRATVAAISPVVGGASLKGPTDRMLAELGMEVSATQVAKLYQDLLDVYIIDEKDRESAEEIERLGIKVVVTQTVMSGPAEKLALARATIRAVKSER